jgi:isochorismate hydrolase
VTGIPTIAPYPLPRRPGLPANVAGWTPAADRAVLLIHDMQRFFLRAFPHPLRDELIDATVRLRARCAQRGVPVAYTAQPGRMSEADRGLLRDFWGPGMRTDARDRAIVPELTPRAADWVLTKWRYSAFFRSDLRERMRACGRDQLIICGVYAHVGVLATALEAFSHDIEPFLVANAVGDFSQADQELALAYAARRCAVVVCAEEVFA